MNYCSRWRLAKYSGTSERLSAQQTTVATHVSLEPESAWSFRAYNQWSRLFGFCENLIAPDKVS